MLDLINCAEGPNPKRVHSTVMDAAVSMPARASAPLFTKVHAFTHDTIFPVSPPTQGENAITHAPWAFKKGDQVFENYGQPNHIYFQYHGFSLEDNTHDCVSVPVSVKSSDPDYEVRCSCCLLVSASSVPLFTNAHMHTTLPHSTRWSL